MKNILTKIRSTHFTVKSLLEKMIQKDESKDKVDSGKGRKRAPLTPLQDQTKKAKISINSQSPTNKSQINTTSIDDQPVKVS